MKLHCYKSWSNLIYYDPILRLESNNCPFWEKIRIQGIKLNHRGINAKISHVSVNYVYSLVIQPKIRMEFLLNLASLAIVHKWQVRKLKVIYIINWLLLREITGVSYTSIKNNISIRVRFSLTWNSRSNVAEIN